MKYWVIEHPTRGYYVGHDVFGESAAFRPRFRWSVTADHEDVEKAFSEAAANTMLQRVQREVPGVYLKVIHPIERRS